jgi:replicative DNA helicase
MSVAELYDDEVPPPRAARRASAATRVPPHDLRAEESLLGAMLLSRDAIAAATEVGLSADDFYKPAHGHVFDAITGLYARGESVDPVTVADLLRRRELLDAVGGPAVLVSLQAGTPATTTAGRYARIVEEHALLRRLIGVAGEIAETAYGVPDDVPATIDRAETLVFEVAQHRVTDSTAKIGDLLDASLNRLEALYERKESITGIPTGYDDLDEILAGLQPSNLVVVGARPSMGKCVSEFTRVLDPDTGALYTAAELAAKAARGEPFRTVSYHEPLGRMLLGQPSAVLDDGVKPTWTVRTRSGREITATATHPFLMYRGWRPLAELNVGDRIAVARSLPYFGNEELPDHEVILLALLIADGGLTTPNPDLTSASPTIAAEFDHAVEAMACRVSADRRLGRATRYRVAGLPGQPNHVTAMLRRHGLMGHGSHTKFVPDAVFRMPRRQIALFLSRLFATDGSAWWTDSGGGYGRISYSTVSKRLAQDVQHLLLRFGLCARIRERRVAYKGTRRLAYELELIGADDIVRFSEQIGIFSKEEQVARLVERCRTKRKGFTADTVPLEAWDDVLWAQGDRSWRSVSVAAGKPISHNRHVDKRAPRRETMFRLADALDEQLLAIQANADVYWDEIVSIEFAGHQQVYDLTVPGLHNFVADDVLVHNTSFALGLATHAALAAQRPVLVFSLEMSQLELSQRILCAEARVDSTRVRTGRLTEADWGKLSHAVGRLADAPIYIDDNANITVMDIRAKARRLRSKLGDLGLIVIDYVQLMTGRMSAESRQVEVSEISRSLKILARELDAPVVALAQLNRSLEQRADKRPMLSDLRESGSLEQDSDVVLFLYRDEVYNPESNDRGTAEVLVSKHRNGPVGRIRLAWLDHYTKFANMAKGV